LLCLLDVGCALLSTTSADKVSRRKTKLPILCPAHSQRCGEGRYSARNRETASIAAASQYRCIGVLRTTTFGAFEGSEGSEGREENVGW
jgi:hypothetical protein